MSQLNNAKNLYNSYGGLLIAMRGRKRVGYVRKGVFHGSDGTSVGATTPVNRIDGRTTRRRIPLTSENRLPLPISTECTQNIPATDNVPPIVADSLYVDSSLAPSVSATLNCVEASYARSLIVPFRLPVLAPCTHCSAKKFYKEPPGFCCSAGSVVLSSHPPPSDLWDLFTSNTPTSSAFRSSVRTYNCAFAFTSFGVKYDKQLSQRNQGIYTFRAQGQAYHYLNSLVPLDGQPSCLQLYFYDTEHEMENRARIHEKLRPSILAILLDIVSDNPFTKFFRSLKDVPSLSECRIIIHENAGLDQRVFNAPASSQVAAIWLESDSNLPRECDIVVYSHPGFCHSVKYYFGCYDPLQYPLLFPLGESGWHEGIQRRSSAFSQSSPCENILESSMFEGADELLASELAAMRKGRRSRTTISCREYYCYKLQIRPSVNSILLHSGRLLQQYVVDMYIKLESSRLDYFRLNQDTIRSELYSGVIDSIAAGETCGAAIGHRFILPATFIGGPRDMRRRYIDAMSLVQSFGKPDIFITMTCNPSWPEITDELLPVEEAQNRPDLVSRVFRAKLEELKNDLLKMHVLGHVRAYVYVVEFQKRGLPHAHFLLIMEQNSRITSPDAYDTIVSAEIPSESRYPHLRSLVRRHMMHGPCGTLNPKNICIRSDGHCKNRFLKDFCERTTQIGDSYPMYMRRDNGENMQVRGHYLDNRWVVPYNPYLLAKFDCHLNVEICSTIKAVKYLYKYVYKGHDQVSFKLGIQKNVNSLDEISLYQSARWVSPPEATWRIYRFLLNEMSPSVVALQVHLENMQPVTFKNNASLDSVIRNPFSKKTMLTEYFAMNRSCPAARQYLYREFPRYFVWHPDQKVWTRRKRGQAIGRLVTVNPAEGERYFLRLLLNHVRGATSYEHLCFVSGQQYNTFREAALALGLLEADDSISACLTEASSYQMPSTMRRLFTTLLVFCNPIDASALWEKFEMHMVEDYLGQSSITHAIARINALNDVAAHIQSMGKKIENYNLPFPRNIQTEQLSGFSEIEEENRIVTPVEDLLAVELLNESQRAAYNTMLASIVENKPDAFFVDGPGGTGKTFLYRALLATVRSKGFVALATASSGVAASILPGGRTAHSRFKIPLNIDDNFGCNVGKQSGLAKLLRAAKVIIWDEAPMVHRQAIEALDQMLQDVCECSTLFGGKVVVFGGDFRQVLPVVPKGNVEKTISACLLKSHIWPKLHKFRLTYNMRAVQDSQFSAFLLRVGDDKAEKFNIDDIKLPPSMVIEQDATDCIGKLINATFPNMNSSVHRLSKWSDIYIVKS